MQSIMSFCCFNNFPSTNKQPDRPLNAIEKETARRNLESQFNQKNAELNDAKKIFSKSKPGWSGLGKIGPYEQVLSIKNDVSKLQKEMNALDHQNPGSPPSKNIETSVLFSGRKNK